MSNVLAVFLVHGPQLHFESESIISELSNSRSNRRSNRSLTDQNVVVFPSAAATTADVGGGGGGVEVDGGCCQWNFLFGTRIDVVAMYSPAADAKEEGGASKVCFLPLSFLLEIWDLQSSSDDSVSIKSKSLTGVEEEEEEEEDEDPGHRPTNRTFRDLASEHIFDFVLSYWRTI
jgi:hypothetical protein